MISQKFKNLRIERGLTQAELAKLAGVSYIQIGRYENGISKPRTKVLQKIIEELDLPHDYFNTDKVRVNHIKKNEILKNTNLLIDNLNSDNATLLALDRILKSFVQDFKMQERKI